MHGKHKINSNMTKRSKATLLTICSCMYSIKDIFLYQTILSSFLPNIKVVSSSIQKGLLAYSTIPSNQIKYLQVIFRSFRRHQQFKTISSYFWDNNWLKYVASVLVLVLVFLQQYFRVFLCII